MRSGSGAGHARAARHREPGLHDRESTGSTAAGSLGTVGRNVSKRRPSDSVRWIVPSCALLASTRSFEVQPAERGDGRGVLCREVDRFVAPPGIPESHVRGGADQHGWVSIGVRSETRGWRTRGRAKNIRDAKRADDPRRGCKTNNGCNTNRCRACRREPVEIECACWLEFRAAPR